MNYLKKNMEEFNKRVKDFEFPDGDEIEKLCYALETTKAGYTTLKYMQDGKVLYVHSKFDPLREGDNFAKKFKDRIERSNIIFLFGLGLGYNARALLKYMNPDNLLIIYEPSWHVFKLAMHNMDISDIIADPRTAFIMGKEEEYLEKYINSFMKIDNYENLIYATDSFYEAKYIDEYKLFLKILSDVVKERSVTYITFHSWGKLWTETIIRNIKHMMDSVAYDSFINVFPNKPVVVVSAGPSLDKNIELLKEIKGKFPIVCVYTAYKALQKHNIKPDFLITLDGEQTIFDSAEYKKQQFDIPVVYLCVSETALIDRCIAGKIYAHTEHDIIVKSLLPDKFFDISGIYVGGTVSASALHFAYFLGGNPIIMVGYDLALNSDKSHAEGTVYAENESLGLKQLESGTIYVDGIDGEKVKTSLIFEHYIRQTEALIAGLPDIKFIDATEGGALKKGSIVDTFANAINEYKDSGAEDIDITIQNILNSEKIFDANDLKQISTNLNEAKKAIVELNNAVKEGKELSEHVLKIFTYGHPDEETVSKIIDRYYELDDIINNITEKYTMFYNVAERIRFVLEADQPYNESKTSIYFAKHSALLYKEMIEITNKINVAFDEMLTSLNNKEYLLSRINNSFDNLLKRLEG